MNMDKYVEKGKSDVQDKLKKAADDASNIGKDFQGVKDVFADMPTGLDTDIVDSLKDAQADGKKEAERDIESIKDSAVKDAKSVADNIKTDVTSKIKDNTSATSKLNAIDSKYAKKGIADSKKALSDSTKMGQDLMKDLEDAQKNADSAIKSIKDAL